MAISIGVVIAILGWLAWRLHFTPQMFDFGIYRRGGQFALDRLPLYGAEFAGPDSVRWTYPPFGALVMIPLTMLPEPFTWLAWMTLIVAAIAAVTCISFRGVIDRLQPRWRFPAAAGLTAIALLSAPGAGVLEVAQIGAFVTLACLLDCVPRSTTLPRGVLVGIVTAIKLVPGLFILHFWLTGQRRAAITAATTTLVCWTFAAVLLWNNTVEYFVRGAMLSAAQLTDVTDPRNQSLYGAITRLIGTGAVATLLWLIVAALAAIVGLARARLAQRRGDVLAAATIVGLTSLLVSPVSWVHHAIWLIPALGVIVGTASDRRRVTAAGVIAALLVWLAISTSPQQLLRVDVLVLLYVVLIVALPTRDREFDDFTLSHPSARRADGHPQP